MNPEALIATIIGVAIVPFVWSKLSTVHPVLFRWAVRSPGGVLDTDSNPDEPDGHGS